MWFFSGIFTWSILLSFPLPLCSSFSSQGLRSHFKGHRVHLHRSQSQNPQLRYLFFLSRWKSEFNHTYKHIYICHNTPVLPPQHMTAPLHALRIFNPAHLSVCQCKRYHKIVTSGTQQIYNNNKDPLISVSHFVYRHTSGSFISRLSLYTRHATLSH